MFFFSRRDTGYVNDYVGLCSNPQDNFSHLLKNNYICYSEMTQFAMTQKAKCFQNHLTYAVEFNIAVSFNSTYIKIEHLQR